MEYDVEFIACRNTWKQWNGQKMILLMELDYTQAGIVEVIERQVDGYIGITAY